MKSSEIAKKYDISEFSVKYFIIKNATFQYKENFWDDIIIPDDVDVDSFFEPLLKEKEEKKMLEAEKIRLKQQEENERKAEEQRKLQAERDRQELIRQQQEEIERKSKEEQYHLRIDKLKEKNADGYYEYKVISLSDVGGLFKRNSGRVDIDTMTKTLNDLGLDGWHLVTAYSNELGKNALSGGAGGTLLGINSTLDENILIFERFVKI